MAVRRNGAIWDKREQIAEGIGPHGRLGLWKFDVTLRAFAPKSSHAQIFFKLATQKGNDIRLPKRQKKLGVTDFVLERTYPEKYLKPEKSGFVS